MKKRGEADSLGKWLIQKVATKDWMIGKVKGEKHYGADTKFVLLEQFGRAGLMQQTKELWEKGLLRVKWEVGYSDWKQIDFPVENMDALMAHEKIPDPRIELQKTKENILYWKHKVSVPWVLAYFEEQLEQTARGNIPKDAKTEGLYRCLCEAVLLERPVWMRRFSEEVFGDSKTFENAYKNRIVTILKRAPEIQKLMQAGFTEKDGNPKTADIQGAVRTVGVSESLILQEFHIMTYSQTLQWKGSVQLVTEEGEILDMSCWQYGAVLNAQTLSKVHIKSIAGIRKVISIENQANYEDMPYDPEVLYIFSHGFFSPKERELIKEIAALDNGQVSYFHWSDMDFGGMRIYEYMKENIYPGIQPYRMDRKAFEQMLESGFGRPISKARREKIENFQTTDLQELKACILEYGMEMEQEAFIEM